MKFRLFTCLVGMLSPAFPAHSHDHGHDHGPTHAAHTHGVAKLEIAVDGPRLNIHLESPQEALLGFEHPPRNAKEKAAAETLMKTLGNGGDLFVLTVAAGCTPSSSAIEAAALQPAAKGKAEEHSDIDADYVYTCTHPDKLTGLEARLFDRFPRLKRLEAQVAGPRGQKAVKLTGKMRFLSW